MMDQWLVNDAQRDRVVDFLRNSYVDGRLSPADFEDRVSRALAAVTRADLNATLAGLAVIGGRVRSSQTARIAPGESLAAGLIGLSPLFLGPLGPMLGVFLDSSSSCPSGQFPGACLVVGHGCVGGCCQNGHACHRRPPRRNGVVRRDDHSRRSCLRGCRVDESAARRDPAEVLRRRSASADGFGDSGPMR